MEDLGEALSSRELTEWAAFERVWGPLLLHERIDLGFAQVSFLLARLLGRGHVSFRDFLPAWVREATAEDSVRSGFERLLRVAEGGDDADHLNAHDRRPDADIRIQ